jgi:hypothetical protein
MIVCFWEFKAATGHAMLTFLIGSCLIKLHGVMHAFHCMTFSEQR